MVYQRIRDLREDADMKQRDIPTAVLIALAELHRSNVDYLLGLTDVRSFYSDLK